MALDFYWGDLWGSGDVDGDFICVDVLGWFGGDARAEGLGLYDGGFLGLEGCGLGLGLVGQWGDGWDERRGGCWLVGGQGCVVESA